MPLNQKSEKRYVSISKMWHVAHEETGRNMQKLKTENDRVAVQLSYTNYLLLPIFDLTKWLLRSHLSWWPIWETATADGYIRWLYLIKLQETCWYMICACYLLLLYIITQPILLYMYVTVYVTWSSCIMYSFWFSHQSFCQAPCIHLHVW